MTTQLGTPQLAAAEPGQSRHWWVLAWTVTFASWCLLWIRPLHAPDDFVFATRAGVPGRGFTLEALGHWLWQDLMVRNGRTTDIITQVAMSQWWLVMLAAAASFVILAWTSYRLIILVHPDFPRWLAFLAGNGLIWAVVFVQDLQAGDTLFFFAATISTVLGLGVAQLTLWLFVTAVRTDNRALLWATIPAAIFFGLFHELGSILLAGFALVGLWLYRGHSLRRDVVAVCIGFIVIAIGRMALPGIWSRAAYVNTLMVVDPNLSSLDILRIRLAAAFYNEQVFLTVIWAFVSAVIALSLIVGLHLRDRDLRRTDIAAIIAGCGGFIIWMLAARRIAIAEYHLTGTPEIYLSHFGSKSALVLLGGVAIWGVAICYLAIRCLVTEVAGIEMGILLGGVLCAGIPSYLGVGQGRQLFITVYAALFFLVVTAWQLFTSVPLLRRGGAEVVARAAIIAALAVSSLLTYGLIVQAPTETVRLWENQIVYYRQLDPQIEAARRGELKRIVMPTQLPHHSTAFLTLAYRPEFPDQFRLFYDLPADVEVVIP